MNEWDKETYDEVIKLFIDRDSEGKITYTGQAYISNLLSMVERLDKQLVEVKEAGEEFLADYGYTTKTRRLAEALRKIKEDAT